MGASAQKRSNYNELGNAKLIRKKRSFTMFNYIITQNLKFVKGFHGNFTKKKNDMRIRERMPF